nr:hypothetical protein [Tanacetum cinerariifolium]
MERLAFCDYHNMIAILEKYENNVDFHPIVDFIEVSYIRVKTSDKGTKIIATVDGKPITIFESSIRRNLKLNDEVGISSLPDAELFENLTLMGYNISPNQKFSFQKEVEQDRANIIKTSTLPSDSTPRDTSFAGDKGSIQHKLQELMDLCTRLQRQQDEMVLKITAQDLEISTLKAKIKLLEDRDGGGDDPSGEDATIKGRNLEIGEEAVIKRSTNKGSNNTDKMRSPLPIFTTATMATPYLRRKGKEKMVESETPKKKKLQEQMDVQMARQLEEEMARDAQRMNEQVAGDVEIARIHAEEELQMLIDSLDRNNETVAKYLLKYEQFAADLSIGERIELINDLVKYQDNYAKVLKYQSQQRKPLSKMQQRDFYMSVLRRHVGWKTKHFKGMSLEEIREKFIPVWKQIEDFVPMHSKEEGERFKRKGLRLEQDSAKKAKISKEVSEEDLKTMMHLVPVKERSYWKIIRLGGSTTSYQFFVDILKHFNKEDLNQLWALVKETLNIRQATMEWRLYDSCGVHHVLSRDQEIFIDEFPLPEDFSTASEERFPLLSPISHESTMFLVCSAGRTIGFWKPAELGEECSHRLLEEDYSLGSKLAGDEASSSKRYLSGSSRGSVSFLM